MKNLKKTNRAAKTMTGQSINPIIIAPEQKKDMKEAAVLTISQRRKRSISMKRRKSRLGRQREIAVSRFASKMTLKRRARMLARELVRKRFVGKRGANYKNLTAAEKIAVDKQIENKQQLINALSNKLIQRIQRKEMERLSRVRSNVKGKKASSKSGLFASYTPEIQNELFEKFFIENNSLTNIQFDILYEGVIEGKKFTEIIKNINENFENEIDKQESISNEDEIVLSEEDIEDIVDDVFREYEDSQLDEKKIMIHKVAVTVSDPKKKNNKIKKFVRVSGIDVKSAENQAKKYYEKAGHKVHTTKYHSYLHNENVNNNPESILSESFVIDKQTGLGVTYLAKDLGIKIKPWFEHHPDVLEMIKERQKKEDKKDD